MSFSTPILLLALLLVPVAVAFGVYMRRRRTRYPIAFTNLDLLSTVLPSNPIGSVLRVIPVALLLLGLASAGVALAGPRSSKSVPQRRAVVVMLVDISGSMDATDIKPSRLSAAVNAMSIFVDRIPPSVEVGLVAFGNVPEIVAPPTYNHQQVLTSLAYLAPSGGTALGDGIATAAQLIKADTRHLASSASGAASRGAAHGAIVLLSDGAQDRGRVQPLQAAKTAKDDGIPVYTIAYGTPNGTQKVEGYGLLHVPPDPQTMEAIARITGGSTFTAESAGQAENVYGHLGSVLAREPVKHSLTGWFVIIAVALIVAAALAESLLGPVFD